MNFSVLPKITGYQPERIDTAFLETEFELADPDIGNGNQIDLLLGSEFYHDRYSLSLPDSVWPYRR